MNTIELVINKEYQLYVKLPCPADQLYYFDGIAIYLRDLKNNQGYLLGQDLFIGFLGMVPRVFKMALAGDLALHHSICNDVGYLWNEYLQEKPGYDFVMVKSEESRSFWVGAHHNIFESPRWVENHYDTWLYNNDNEIILKLAHDLVQVVRAE